MLHIHQLHASVSGKEVLKGVNLHIKPGEIHAIMGPNGAGKSSLASVLAGREEYVVTKGDIKFRDKDLLAMAPEVRAREGLFLAFQYPVAIPGVSTEEFLRTSLNEIRKYRSEQPLDAFEFHDLVAAKLQSVSLREEFLERSMNDGFSGGEKKRNEVLQMLLLEPALCILDETDSGLDVDALKTVAAAIKSMRVPDRSFLVITHYERVLAELEPDIVHIFHDGRIVKSGDRTLAERLEKEGYDAVIADPLTPAA